MHGHRVGNDVIHSPGTEYSLLRDHSQDFHYCSGEEEERRRRGGEDEDKGRRGKRRKKRREEREVQAIER